MTKGTFWERLIARIIDDLLFSAVFLVALAFIGLTRPNLSQLTSSLLILAALMLNEPLIKIAYNSWLTSKYGGTLGKLVLGLEVLDENGKKLKKTLSIFRHTAGYLVSGTLFFLGYFWILRKDKLAWHDLMAGTVVIKKKPHRAFVTAVFVITLVTINIAALAGIILTFSSNQNLRNDVEGLVKSISSVEIDKPTKPTTLETV